MRKDCSIGDLKNTLLANRIAIIVLTVDSTSKNYEYNTKFSRLTKYIVEWQVEMFDIENSEKETSTNDNLEKFKRQVDENLKMVIKFIFIKQVVEL